MAFVIRELLDAGLLHGDILTVARRRHATTTPASPVLEGDDAGLERSGAESGDETMLRPAAAPFQPDGGMRLVAGQSRPRDASRPARSSASRWTIEAPAPRLRTTRTTCSTAFKAGELDRDVVVVVRFQGPRANGMPELHKLTPPLGVLQDRGFKVALVTDGRMSGASGQGAGRDPLLARGAGRRPARQAARRRRRPALRRRRHARRAGRCRRMGSARRGRGAAARTSAPAASCSPSCATAPTRPSRAPRRCSRRCATIWAKA